MSEPPDYATRLLAGDIPVAASITPTSADYLAWVCVVPLHGHVRGVDPPDAHVPETITRYRVIVGEVPRSFDYHNYDLHPEYIRYIENVVVDELELVWTIVRRHLADLSALDEEFKSDCPL